MSLIINNIDFDERIERARNEVHNKIDSILLFHYFMSEYNQNGWVIFHRYGAKSYGKQAVIKEFEKRSGKKFVTFG